MSLHRMAMCYRERLAKDSSLTLRSRCAQDDNRGAQDDSNIIRNAGPPKDARALIQTLQ